MYRDDRLEFKKGSLLVKKTEITTASASGMDTGEDGKLIQKQKRSTKFDFSGTNYLAKTLGYRAGMEDEHNMDSDLFTKICDRAKKASGARKPACDPEDVEDKYASIRLDPAFIARASLRSIISGRIRKTEDGENLNSEVHNLKMERASHGASDRDDDAQADEALDSGEVGGGGCEPVAEVSANELEAGPSRRHAGNGSGGEEPELEYVSDHGPGHAAAGESTTKLCLRPVLT